MQVEADWRLAGVEERLIGADRRLADADRCRSEQIGEIDVCRCRSVQIGAGPSRSMLVDADR